VTAGSGQPPIRVLIADDQRVVRDGLAMLIGLIDAVQITGAASDGEEAVRLAVAHRPDVVLMDLRMPGTDGITATAQLRERLPSARILVLTTYADEDTVLAALRAGAHGYLTKDASAEQIEAAIRAVYAGQTHLDPLAQERLVAAVTAPLPQPPAPAVRPPPAGLTPGKPRCSRCSQPGFPMPRSPGGCTSATPPSRPTSTGSSPRPAPVTARRPSATPTRPAWRIRPSDSGIHAAAARGRILRPGRPKEGCDGA
jgi:DNA-binding NarL/FixJ family response regulator